MSKPQRLNDDFYVNNSDKEVEILIPAGEIAKIGGPLRGYERAGGDHGDSVILLPGESLSLA